MAECSSIDSSNHGDDDSDVDMVANGVVSADTPAAVPDRFGFIGGNQYTNFEDARIPVEIVRARELKWVSMVTNWDYMVAKKWKKIRDRCRKGIPSSMRCQAWEYLCRGPRKQKDPNSEREYRQFVSQECDQETIRQIRRDIARQFPHHELFTDPGGQGVEGLFRVLKAVAMRCPMDGYCQGQGPLAAVLLMHMPEEAAFWTLVSVFENYLPRYYETGLEKVQVDGEVLYALLKHISPAAYNHLRKYEVEPIFFMVDWFMCIFCRNLPWPTVLRVLDMFFCEGIKVVFRVAVAVIKLIFEQPHNRSKYSSMEETISVLRNLPGELTSEHILIKESTRLASQITANELERLNRKHLRMFREKKMQEKQVRAAKEKKNSGGGAVGDSSMVNGRR